MAKYPVRACPKCNRHLGIVVPRTQGQVARAGNQWTVLEMWLSAGVGGGSRENVSGTNRTKRVKSHTIGRYCVIDRLRFI
jgi:hypothetical protein